MARPTRNQRPNDVPVIVISLATTLAWGSLFALPERISLALVCGVLFMIGIWSLLFPSRLLEWATPTRFEIDTTDPKLSWIARGVGTLFIVMSVAAVAVAIS